MKLSLFSTSFLAATAAAATQFSGRPRLSPPSLGGQVQAGGSVAAVANGTKATNGTGFFTQLLDHSDPSKGTFQQKYYWNSEFWKGPGSPVVVFTPGEEAADPYIGYLTNRTITGLYAQEIEGAVLMVEHRYWGHSSPYAELNAETLQYLTLDNSLLDLVNIARTLDLPFDVDNCSNAPKAPWVLSGGSYSGAISAWMESLYPGTFWAYHASSAPVEAIYNYWEYFYPIQQGMAKNCSSDVTAAIDYIDHVLAHGSKHEIHDLKAQFGLEALEHNADFTAVLANGPYLWQENAFYTGYSGFFQFCDAIEGVAAGAPTSPGPNGVGAKKAVANYASYIKSTFLPGYCEQLGYNGTLNTDCLNTYDPNNILYTASHVSDAAVAFTDRQWVWMTCNEPFAYWQTGAPEGRASLVSRYVTAEYFQRQCGLYFPEVNGFTYGSANPAVNTHALNARTKGWDLTHTTRLIWTNGEFDPWRTSGASSQFRPGGPLASTAQHPLQIIPGGFHCSDLILGNAEANAGVQTVVDNEVAQIVAWVKEFYAQ